MRKIIEYRVFMEQPYATQADATLWVDSEGVIIGVTGEGRTDLLGAKFSEVLWEWSLTWAKMVVNRGVIMNVESKG